MVFSPRAARDEALQSLRYFEATQESDGHWAQNQWVDGTRNWKSIQMDETALPILLLNQLRREGVISDQSLFRYWPMVRSALGFLLRNGPSTLEDRWENARGFTPFTLAVSISAAVVAAEIAEICGEPALGDLFRDTADAWNDSLERWTYVENTELAHQLGVAGYYLRIAPLGPHGNPSKYNGTAEPHHKRPSDASGFSPAAIVSPDALAYVRFGLRSPDDPRIVNTIKVIDALLKVETPSGPAWHRYNHDGYGEKSNGSPFDYSRGIGRAWPLLTGERAHYELAAGRKGEAERLLAVMAAFANDTGMLPEQVWDSASIPERDLCFGKPTGSAMPLAWAHAEYLKLRRSLEDNRVFDMPAQTERRYLVEKTVSRVVIWRACAHPRWFRQARLCESKRCNRCWCVFQPQAAIPASCPCVTRDSACTSPMSRQHICRLAAKFVAASSRSDIHRFIEVTKNEAGQCLDGCLGVGTLGAQY